MRLAPSSLRGRLLLGLGLGLSVLWLGLALWLHHEVRDRVAAVLDERLAASARMVASLVDAGAAAPAALAEGGRLPLRGIACEVSGLRGELLARSSGAPEGGLALAEDGFGQRRLDGEVWRVFTVTQGDLRVASAERMAGRTGFMRQVALVLLAALSLGLLASLALVWWAVGRALGPLSSLRDQLAGRDAGDRRAVATPPGAVELEPMVATLNQVLGRERDALDRERRLTDDLAHELRTPWRRSAPSCRWPSAPRATAPTMPGTPPSRRRNGSATVSTSCWPWPGSAAPRRTGRPWTRFWTGCWRNWRRRCGPGT
ncbi:hypothetical protein HML84_13840 [Alcanivorax sp. IO_7]|nr:hypothetical protein HML84_13840 [Alcanivorax sp. IO_7]